VAVPPLVVAGAAELLTNATVRRAGARLVSDVYGRLMRRKPGGPAAAADGAQLDPAEAVAQLSEAVADLPTREEIVAAFSLLQTEVDNRLRRIGIAVALIGLLQIVGIGLLILG
jgi:hypothetical protein